MAGDKDDIVAFSLTFSAEVHEELKKRQKRYGFDSLEETILFELRLDNFIIEDGVIKPLPSEE